MRKLLSIATLTAALVIPLTANAYESGSTGADGVFNPTADTQLTLPPSGILNFTDVTIPEGVTVTFAKNANNTPVYILASGDVTIDGTINVSGGKAGNEGNGSRGRGGPGGFDGGHGGLRSSNGAIAYVGENGLGPGAGEGGATGTSVGPATNGSGGGYRSSGTSGDGVSGGKTYGQANLRTLIGGSGGGGGAGYSYTAPGGGGGGGAILIAASGTVAVNGSLLAQGGNSGNRTVNAGFGGSGSGGAIRVVATTIQGNGTISADGGSYGRRGGSGRIRLEAETMVRTADSSPSHSFARPYPAFYSDLPSVRITTIGGETVPTNSSGFRDIVLPGVTTNPITVGFETTNIPLGTTITLVSNPELGADTRATSTGISGSEALGSATAEINLPNGNATLFAYTAFTITLADNSLAEEYSKYAQGEPVEKVRIDVDTNGQSETTFITFSGNEYSWPSNTVALN